MNEIIKDETWDIDSGASEDDNASGAYASGQEAFNVNGAFAAAGWKDCGCGEDSAATEPCGCGPWTPVILDIGNGAFMDGLWTLRLQRQRSLGLDDGGVGLSPWRNNDSGAFGLTATRDLFQLPKAKYGA